MSHGVINYIILDGKIVHAVEGRGSIEGMVDGASFDIRLSDSSNHVEVQRISS